MVSILGNFEWHIFMAHIPIFFSLFFRQLKWAQKLHTEIHAHMHMTYAANTGAEVFETTKNGINKNENAFTAHIK